MGAWDKCKSAMQSGALDEGEDEVDTPLYKNKYALSLATVISVVCILWMIRPSFVNESGKGARKGHLMTGRVLLFAFIGGAVVLSAPMLKTTFGTLQSMVNAQ